MFLGKLNAGFQFAPRNPEGAPELGTVVDKRLSPQRVGPGHPQDEIGVAATFLHYLNDYLQRQFFEPVPSCRFHFQSVGLFPQLCELLSMWLSKWRGDQGHRPLKPVVCLYVFSFHFKQIASEIIVFG